MRLKEIELILDARHEAACLANKPLRDEAKALGELLARRYWITDKLFASWDQIYERLDVMTPRDGDGVGLIQHLINLTAAEMHLYAEVMALFEVWRRGELENLPPTGTWLQAKIVLLSVMGHDWVRRHILHEEI